MTIREALAANRAAYQRKASASPREELPLPSSSALWEEGVFEASSSQAPAPSAVYRLEAGTFSPAVSLEATAPSTGEDALLDRLVRRMERENRLASQPLADD